MPPGKPQQPNNPYAAAAGTYGTNLQKHTPDQRELEAHVLLKSAKFLQDTQNDWDNVTGQILEDILRYNRQIWMMFYDTALQNPEGDRPDGLRNNILSLAQFVFKREMDILAKPEKKKLDILISINRDIAAGLMEGAKKAPPPTDADKQKPPEGGTSTSA